MAPRPNLANLRPAGVSAVTTAAFCAACQARWIRADKAGWHRRATAYFQDMALQPEAASWPQAPSISRPRVSLIVTGTPQDSSRRTNSSVACCVEAVHLDPGVG